MTRRAALCHIGCGYVFSLSVAVLPVFWNRFHEAEQCEFNEVITPWYVAGVIAPAFSIVWICLLITYSRIWHEAAKHAKQMRSSGHDGPSDWKSVQVGDWHFSIKQATCVFANQFNSSYSLLFNSLFPLLKDDLYLHLVSHFCFTVRAKS